MMLEACPALQVSERRQQFSHTSVTGPADCHGAAAMPGPPQSLKTRISDNHIFLEPHYNSSHHSTIDVFKQVSGSTFQILFTVVLRRPSKF
jgi:hypothetical protein